MNSKNRLLVRTAWIRGNVIASEVLKNKDQNYGYDARAGEYTDMVKRGVIDPTKVVRSALQNAASVATLLLTSDALVADAPKDGEKKKGGGGYDDIVFHGCNIYISASNPSGNPNTGPAIVSAHLQGGVVLVSP